MRPFVGRVAFTAVTSLLVLVLVGSGIICVVGPCRATPSALASGEGLPKVNATDPSWYALSNQPAAGLTRDVETTDIRLRIGSTEATIDSSANTLESAPYIKNGRTMVPVRFITEGLGALVGWNGTEKTVTISYEGKTVRLWIDKDYATVDSLRVSLDASPEIKSSRTFVPIRFIAENFAATVAWNADIKEVSIQKETKGEQRIDEGFDADGDGLSFAEERGAGTNPNVADTDSDGLSDGKELNVCASNPLAYDSTRPISEEVTIYRGPDTMGFGAAAWIGPQEVIAVTGSYGDFVRIARITGQPDNQGFVLRSEVTSDGVIPRALAQAEVPKETIIDGRRFVNLSGRVRLEPGMTIIDNADSKEGLTLVLPTVEVSGPVVFSLDMAGSTGDWFSAFVADGLQGSDGAAWLPNQSIAVEKEEDRAYLTITNAAGRGARVDLGPIGAIDEVTVQLVDAVGSAVQAVDTSGRILAEFDEEDVVQLGMTRGLLSSGLARLGVVVGPGSVLCCADLLVEQRPTGKAAEGFRPKQGLPLADLSRSAGIRIGAVPFVNMFEAELSWYAENFVSNRHEVLGRIWGPTWDTAPAQDRYAGYSEVISQLNLLGISAEGAHLLWWGDYNSRFPHYWLRSFADSPLSREQWETLISIHVGTTVAAYRGKMWSWSVINEEYGDDGAPRSTPWHDALGLDLLRVAFRAARAGDPGTLLYYNDFGMETVNQKSVAVAADLAKLKREGILIDGVGLQMHLNLNYRPSKSEILSAMLLFRDAGLKVLVTEMDVDLSDGEPGVSHEQLMTQAQIYRDVLEAALESGCCPELAVWGPTDARTWLTGLGPGKGEAPTMFDMGWQPKPAFYAIWDTLAGWVEQQ